MQLQFGEDRAVEGAQRAEYIWNRDPSLDPFAQIYSK